MVSLVSHTPAAGLLPVEHGATRLSEVLPEAITSVMPFKDREAEVSAALEAAIGGGFPAPGRTTGKSGARAVWFGPGQALVLGPKVSVQGAATTDQSDAWAVLKLEGGAAEEVLARLVPIDLRRASFKRGRTARTLLGHMTASVTRVDDSSFEIMVFRSMAATAVHEIERAMKFVAGRER